MRRATVGVLAATMMLLGVESIQAQPSMMLGFKAGLNFSELDLDEGVLGSVEADTRKGVAVGAFLTFMPSSFISIQPEVNYTQWGSEFVVDGIENELKITYIQVPLLAKFNFGPMPGMGVRPHLALGPYAAYVADCDFTFGQEGDFDCAEDDDETGSQDLVKQWDFGGVFGGGLEFSGARGSLIIDGRYNLGLADVFEDEGNGTDGSTGDDNAQNNVWTIMIGFAVPFGGM